MLQLIGKLQQEISWHGERDYPYEACGALLGFFAKSGMKTVAETYPISNSREEEKKRNRFLIRPEELIAVEKLALSHGLEVIGFYHSHPDHPAVPSQYDKEHAWPTYSYVVVSIEHGRARQLRSWELVPDRSRFNEEEILKGP